MARVDNVHHLLARLHRRAIMTGRSVGAPPNFRGMSGGGVWPYLVTEEPGPSNPPLFAGIIIERPAGYRAALLVTRATIVQAFIERFDEE